MTLYRTIYADPPWPERGGGKSKRGADRHYKVMPVRKIKALPVGDIADPAGCVLWLWATGNYLADAIDCAREWGFRVVNFRPWVKAQCRWVGLLPGSKGTEDDEDFWRLAEVPAYFPQNPGLGQYMRCDAEILLLCVRGKVDLPPIKTRQTIYAPRVTIPALTKRGKPTERVDHSAKPHSVQVDIETNYSAPRLEMFARQRREGWDAFGDQVEGSIVLPGAPCPTP